MISRWFIERIVNILGYRLVREAVNTVPFDGHTSNKHQAPRLEALTDYELRTLNDILPWNSYLIDDKGRRFGKPFSHTKRNEPESIPDPRIVKLNEMLPLQARTVLELGCFEGNHTSALSNLAKRVIALDSRIENVVKTIIRCHFLGTQPEVHCIDLETPLPTNINFDCDVLHHVGVLYHLSDPVRHLQDISKHVREAIFLDTHIAQESDRLHKYEASGKIYPYYRFEEGGRSGPFAGMRSHAKWLLQSDLVNLLASTGFRQIEIFEVTQQRNGLRISLLAQRGS